MRRLDLPAHPCTCTPPRWPKDEDPRTPTFYGACVECGGYHPGRCFVVEVWGVELPADLVADVSGRGTNLWTDVDTPAEEWTGVTPRPPRWIIVTVSSDAESPPAAEYRLAARQFATTHPPDDAFRHEVRAALPPQFTVTDVAWIQCNLAAYRQVRSDQPGVDVDRGPGEIPDVHWY